LYISNCPPKEPPDEKLLIAHEVRELMLLLIEAGQQATHDELHYVLEMMNLMIDELENDAAIDGGEQSYSY